MGVGKRIKERRKELHISQSTLAKSAGISQSGLSTIESEHNGATSATLQAIASALNCSISYLMGEDTKSPENTSVVATQNISSEEKELLHLYRCLNHSGKSLLLSTAHSFACNPDMKKEKHGASAI